MTFSSFKLHLCAYFAALSLLALASCGGGDGGDNTGSTTQQPGSSTTTLAAAQELVNTFAATLTGAEEIPPTASAAQGSGTIVINPGTRVATATISTSGISGTTANIQEGQPGTTGPVIFSLNETAPGSGIWTTKLTLNEAQLNSLQAGNFYFNIGSATFPNGEIRGQILSQQAIATSGTSGSGSVGNVTNSGLNAAAAIPNTFIAALRGLQETPPNASIAQGSGAVVTNQTNRSVLVAVTTAGIAGTAAHIHSGAPGVAGPIIVPLAETPAGSGVWTASATLTEDQYSTLTSGGLYLNVHSAAFPEGEIRGQILPVQQSVASQTGTGSFGSGLPGTTGTGVTGTTGTGFTGIGTTGIGATGIGTTGIGTTGIGTIGTGTTGIGTTGIGTTGIGTTGIGTTGIGTTGIGTTGIGTIGTGTIGTGTIGTGTTGIGTTGIGTTGIGTTGIGTIGTGTTGTGAIGTGTTTGMGTTGTGLITFGA